MDFRQLQDILMCSDVNFCDKLLHFSSSLVLYVQFCLTLLNSGKCLTEYTSFTAFCSVVTLLSAIKYCTLATSLYFTSKPFSRCATAESCRRVVKIGSRKFNVHYVDSGCVITQVLYHLYSISERRCGLIISTPRTRTDDAQFFYSKNLDQLLHVFSNVDRC
ncbi:nucleolar MIF4G domain-containing protein 1 [Trichinella spiralis]|uniref:nucleolar MIF4G domain-containing protein 1 n=1 Tax=Trichinella spiralis TaxID=6334 RepID=UPI0001EFC07A|nr:nucleolar MIF4G domain-containing protein 1 [Trichinella spiralis]